MGTRGRARRTALVVACIAGFVAAACAPEPPSAPPPPAPSSAPSPPPALVVYGDSLTAESNEHLLDRLAALLPGYELVIRAWGGTAQCDWHADMQRDAADLDVRGVVIAFTGNYLTSCITSRPHAAGYRADAEWAAGWWRSHGVPLAFVAGPTHVGVAPADDVIGNIYRAVGAARGVVVADPSPFFSHPSTGVFARWMPCLVGECTTIVQVRADDGTHLCLPAGCRAYSSGVVRYVESMVHAVATILGREQPPVRTMVPLTPTTSTTTASTTTTSTTSTSTTTSTLPLEP